MKNFNFKASVLVLLLFMLELVIVTQGDYIMQVRTYSYSNPTESCALCIGSNGVSDVSPRCCDSEDTTCIGLVSHCDTYYRYCLRPLGTNTTSGCTGSAISDINENDAPIDFLQPTVLGLSNPLTLRGSTAEWSGVQLFIEVVDRDPINSFDDIIDRFFIDIFPADFSIGEESSRTSYRGVFMLAEMELSLRVDCAENFAGPTCSECEVGYTGPFCRTDIDECQGVNCSGHGQCEDGRSSFTCNCEPGFTGELCDTNIDEKRFWQNLHFGVYVGIGAGLVVMVMIVLLVLVTVVVLVKKKKKKQRKDSKAQDDTYYVEPEGPERFVVQHKNYNCGRQLEDRKTTTLFPPDKEEPRYSGIYEVVT